MRGRSWLWTAIIGLFALNIMTLGFVYLNDGGREKRPPPRKFDQLLINSLQLDSRQIEMFDMLKREHHRQILQLDAEMRAPVTAYFNQLTTGRDTAGNTMLEKEIIGIYQTKLRITYEHFEEIRNMCTPQQRQHFDEIIPEMMQVMEARHRETRVPKQ